MMTAEKFRAARGLLRWSARELSLRTSVHISTIQRLERYNGPVHGTMLTIRKIQQAFEDSGVTFLDDEEGLGVRMRKSVVPQA